MELGLISFNICTDEVLKFNNFCALYISEYFSMNFSVTNSPLSKSDSNSPITLSTISLECNAETLRFHSLFFDNAVSVKLLLPIIKL